MKNKMLLGSVLTLGILAMTGCATTGRSSDELDSRIKNLEVVIVGLSESVGELKETNEMLSEELTRINAKLDGYPSLGIGDSNNTEIKHELEDDEVRLYNFEISVEIDENKGKTYGSNEAEIIFKLDNKSNKTITGISGDLTIKSKLDETKSDTSYVSYNQMKVSPHSNYLDIKPINVNDARLGVSH